MATDSYQLVVRNAPQSGLTAGQVIALEDDELTMGRDPLSGIILDDAEVSRHHAKLMLQAGGYELQDLGSTNGTFVDGKRLGGEPVALAPGQVIMLGSNVTLVYQAIAAVDPLATMVAPVAAAEFLEEAVQEEPAAVEEIVEEVVEEVEIPMPEIAPAELEPETIDEPEVIVEEVLDVDDEEEFATMMDESPLAAPIADAAPDLEPFPEVAPESEPFPEFTPEPEPFPEVPALPVEEPAFDPPPVPEAQAATFDELDERTYVDSAAPVSDLLESPVDQRYAEVPTPSAPEFDEPEEKAGSNRNMIIIAVVVVLLICCCLTALAVALVANGAIGNI